MTLNELAKRAHENAVNKGFYEKPLETGTLLMLVVSELSEALEADRKGIYANIERFNKWINEPTSVCTFNELFEDSIKDSFQDELADVIIRILDLCGHKGIDIDWHIEQKMRYNETREFKHGKAY